MRQFFGRKSKLRRIINDNDGDNRKSKALVMRGDSSGLDHLRKHRLREFGKMRFELPDYLLF